MPFSVKNLNCNSSPKFKDNVNFTGLRTGKILHLDAIKTLSGCHLDDIFESLSKKVAPDFIQDIGSDSRFLKGNSFLDTLKYPFVKMPKEILNCVANKFHIESLQNGKILTNFRKAGENDAYQRAMRGLLCNGDNFLNGVAKELKIDPKDIEKYLCKNGCNKDFKNICDKVTGKFYELFDNNFARDKAHYHTPHERTVVRLVSGITAAVMLGNDFYNKSIINGKSEIEATDEATSKRKQEVIATVEEAASQYLLLGGFSGFANNSKLGAPILNTLLGILFHVTSRLSTGKPLTRIKVPEKSQYNCFSLDNFMDSIKNHKEFSFGTSATPKEQEPQKEEKKHLLTPKNIALACLASVGVGFALKGVKSTKIFNSLKDSVMNFKPIKALSENIRNSTIQEVWKSEQELESLADALIGINKKKTYNFYYKDLFKEAFSDPKLTKQFKNPDGSVVDKIFVGEYEKMTHIPFTKIQVSKRELMQVPLMPFKLIKELVSYPYQAVHKIFEGLKIVKKPKKFELKNDYHIMNTLLDFEEQFKKHGSKVDDKFIEFYSKHFESNRISSLNKETQSGVKNAAVGKTTQLLGTFGSLYFAMTDDFNRTAKQTGDKQKAEKDARLRGVNKIIRIATQLSIMGLNDVFKIPYAASIFGAGAITAVCTILTDGVSRVLSGMPFRKMNKEELEQYNKSKKEGPLKAYYNVIDKLTE